MEEILAAGLDAQGGWEHVHWDRLPPVFPLTIARLAKTKTTMADMAVEIPGASEIATKTGSRTKVAQVGEHVK